MKTFQVAVAGGRSGDLSNARRAVIVPSLSLSLALLSATLDMRDGMGPIVMVMPFRLTKLQFRHHSHVVGNF